MDKISSEMLRGHIDTIILLSLLQCDKHTSQIKEEIESRVDDGQFELKQGTFYSCLQRIVSQGYVMEYRSSAQDGKRRKYYQLTEKGKSYIEDNKDKWLFSRNVIDVLIQVPKDSTPIDSVYDYEKEQQKAQEIKEKESKIDQLDTKIDELTSKLEQMVMVATTQQQPQESPSEPEISVIEEAITQEEIITSQEEITKTPSIRDADLGEIEMDANEYLKQTQLEFEALKNGVKQEEIFNSEKTDNDFDKVINIKDISSKIEKNEAEVNNDNPISLENEAELMDLYTKEDEVSLNSLFYAEKAPDVAIGEPVINEQPKKVVQQTMQLEEAQDDFYNGEETIADYRGILSKIFPQSQQQQEFFVEEQPVVSNLKEDVYVEAVDNNYEQQMQFEEATNTTEIAEQKKTLSYDFSDIYSLADKEGFKIKTSTSSSRGDLGKILINKLVASSSLTFYIFILLEIAILAFTTSKIAGFSWKYYVIFASALAIFPLASLIAFAIDPKKKVSAIISFKSVIEFSFIITLNLILVVFVVAILINIDFTNPQILMTHIFYPILFIINLPIYFFIKYLKLDNQRFFS